MGSRGVEIKNNDEWNFKSLQDATADPCSDANLKEPVLQRKANEVQATLGVEPALARLQC